MRKLCCTNGKIDKLIERKFVLNLKKTRENSLKKIRNYPKNRDVIQVV
jgi:hypothetical protein